MCGICGKIHFDKTRKADPGLLRKMTAVLSHRGPDDSGICANGYVGLGHQRLSIIDLTDAGHQPMANEDDSIQIVFNGEIYNFEELRKDLEKKGHIFRSHTDTEAIIHLYEEEGTDCVKFLRGMFAFALWDSSKDILFLSRDRAGKKPLVYTEADNSFIFASEIKSLLQDTAVIPEVENEALHHFLTYQYVPGPLTVFKKIKKLPPAHSLILKNGNITIERYWNLSYAKDPDCKNLSTCCEKLVDVFTDAVKVRLRSDVPLGAFLSGGVDSSATVAVMSKLMNRPVKTFTIGFEESDYNELPYAKIIAEKYQTEHTEFVVKPDAIKILPKLIWHYDEPYADPSAIPTYYVSKLTREHVTVALNGDGADESFAGYERYAANRLAAYYENIPETVRENIIKKAVNLFPYSEKRWSLTRRLKRFINGVQDTKERRYIQWFCYFNNERKNALYTDTFKNSVSLFDSIDFTANLYSQTDAQNLIDKTLFVDINSYLPYDLLVKMDIASMANSLEARSPFLDHKVMEFAASIPAGLKLRGMQTKYILKKAFEPMVPKEILYRKKMGFGVPLHKWFQQDLKEPAYDILLDKKTIERGYFKEKEIKKLLDDHISLKEDNSYRIWALLWLELWHRMFIDKRETLGI